MIETIKITSVLADRFSFQFLIRSSAQSESTEEREMREVSVGNLRQSNKVRITPDAVFFEARFMRVEQCASLIVTNKKKY